MFAYLKQSTASQTKIIGPFVDDTDFKTAETGLTIANTDIKLSKNGQAAADKNSGGGTHIANGSYAITFDATDTDTVGELFLSVSVTGALVVNAKFYVLEESIYDAMFGASAAGFDSNGRVDLGAMGGDAQSLADLKDFADAGYDPATSKVQGVALVDTTTTNTDMRGTDGANTTTPPTVGAIADQVWLETLSDHSSVSGSMAEALNAAGSAGDPWTTSLPGSYTGSQAGKILKDVLDDVTGLNGDAMRGTDGANTTAPPSAADIASAVLKRDVDQDESTMPEHCLGTVILAMLESKLDGGTFTIYRTDHATIHATKTATTNTSADPVVELN